MSMRYGVLTRILGEFLASTMYTTFMCMNQIVGDVPIVDRVLKYHLNGGLVMMVCVFCFYAVSGAHINPAVTLTAYIMDVVSMEIAGAYILLQFVGAMFGYLMLLFIFPKEVTHDAMGMCFLYPMGSMEPFQVIGVEFVLTTTHLLFCCAMWDQRNQGHNETLPLRYGLMFGSLSLSGVGVTGPSTNIARTLAPAIFQQNFDFIYMFATGHLLAVIVVSLLWKYLYISNLGMIRQDIEDFDPNETRL